MTSCAEISEALAPHVDQLVPRLLSHAVRHGGYWLCGDVSGTKGDSLTVIRRSGHWKDFATGEHGDLLDLINATVYAGGNIREARHWALTWLGNLSLSAIARETPRHDRDAEDRCAIEHARAIWRCAEPIAGTLGELYLRSRAIILDPPASLRFAPKLYHPRSTRRFPAMVAAISDNAGKVTAVLKTFLAPDGSGKADIEPVRMMTGRVLNNACRLGPAGRELGLSEGIETGLSAMQLHGVSVWAACGTGMARVTIPDSVERLIIFRDNGTPGEQAAERAVAAHEKPERIIEIVAPPEDVGDWNDVARRQAGSDGHR
jgi:hypothetical protein